MKRCLLALLAALVLGATGPASAQNPAGNCPPGYRGGGYFYPYPLLYPFGYTRNRDAPTTPAPTDVADAESAAAEPADSAEEPAETYPEEEGTNEVINEDPIAVIEKIENETGPTKGRHLVFKRFPENRNKNQFVLVDGQGRVLALIKLYWNDPAKRSAVSVSVKDGEVEGIQTWRKELWDKINDREGGENNE